MKNLGLKLAGITLLSSVIFGAFTSNVAAENANSSPDRMKGSADVSVKASESTDRLDPENPLTSVDPGEGPSTDGPLRIDFASTINFGDAEITSKDRVYPSLAQLFHSDTPARGAYVQITDVRSDSPGWTLQLKQETQFKNADNIELTGGVLSFDKIWASSGGTSGKPDVFRDVIAIDTFGASYQLASASKGSGSGTWMIVFGASESNQFGQANTITPLLDKDGKNVVDSSYNKNAYTNSAITLSIPDETSIQPGEYQTELTWILQASPL